MNLLTTIFHYQTGLLLLSPSLSLSLTPSYRLIVPEVANPHTSEAHLQKVKTGVPSPSSTVTIANTTTTSSPSSSSSASSSHISSSTTTSATSTESTTNSSEPQIPKSRSVCVPSHGYFFIIIFFCEFILSLWPCCF